MTVAKNIVAQCRMVHGMQREHIKRQVFKLYAVEVAWLRERRAHLAALTDATQADLAKIDALIRDTERRMARFDSEAQDERRRERTRERVRRHRERKETSGTRTARLRGKCKPDRRVIPLNGSEVREVPLPLAREIVERFEPMPAQCRLAYGIFFDGACGGVVVFSDEYAENLGVWDRYGFSGKIILLSRGVCLHWAPKNANSRLVRQAMQLLPPQYEIVTATTDATLGERGVIYRAAGFVRARMISKGGKYIVNGAQDRTRRHKGLAAKGDGIAAKRQPAKARWFAFRGSHKAKRRHREAIAHLIHHP